jgi:hypothetical protein
MKIFAYLASFALLSSGCMGKVSGTKPKITTRLIAGADTIKPKVSWKVNRVVDDKGNLIRYDSTYSWSYSSKTEVASPQTDSLIKDFQARFHLQMENVFNSNNIDPLLDGSFQNVPQPGLERQINKGQIKEAPKQEGIKMGTPLNIEGQIPGKIS